MSFDTADLTDPVNRQQFHMAVAGWYKDHGRRLPWRSSADPYRIWISEIMLQQTTVATVVPYFNRFILRFPDVRSLAEASPDEVLRLWEGLGYYSRARNLHKAATIIDREYSGQFPVNADALKSLPGIGRYTAGAIASFAFDLPEPIVEANTLRLYARLMALDLDPRSAAGQRALWAYASDLLLPAAEQPSIGPGDLNQAMMDLGATVCTITDPDCSRCPLTGFCRAFASRQQHRIPPDKKRPEITRLTEVSLAIRRDGNVLMRQRDQTERWTGLWDFVRFEIDAADSGLPFGFRVRKSRPSTPAKVSEVRGSRSLYAVEESVIESIPLPSEWIERVLDETGYRVNHGTLVTQIRHAVTRYRIQLFCLESAVAEGRLKRNSGYRWLRADQLDQLPLSTTGRQFARLLWPGPPSAGDA